VADGVWPPPGGPDHLAIQQGDFAGFVLADALTRDQAA